MTQTYVNKCGLMNCRSSMVVNGSFGRILVLNVYDGNSAATTRGTCYMLEGVAIMHQFSNDRFFSSFLVPRLCDIDHICVR